LNVGGVLSEGEELDPPGVLDPELVLPEDGLGPLVADVDPELGWFGLGDDCTVTGTEVST
jgi:hypothetical protein